MERPIRWLLYGCVQIWQHSVAYFWDGLDRVLYIGRQRTEKPGIFESAFFCGLVSAVISCETADRCMIRCISSFASPSRI